jgi:lipopolysaccharide transport system ATP-binding protein
MSAPMISVENVSKAYRLGQIGGGTLREDVARWWAKLRGKTDPFLKIGEEHHARKMGEQFWALSNINFQVKEGQVLGIIGHNGAGKSTLLKILSQVTTPTSGQIKIKGRIASLLEVGTGFHPELTGRENVFLNGAILGMTKVEIRSKFDEIVAFSEIEEFIDTPVKRYSSGMYVRLAFAVAAHLEPEILICDEVLAVGDVEFQKKCLGKMQDVAGDGRTILFVSHNMLAVQRLCNSVCWLKDGRVKELGSVDSVTKSYLSSHNPNISEWIRPEAGKAENKPVIKRIRIYCHEDKYQSITVNDRIVISVDVYNPLEVKGCQVAVRVSTFDDLPVFTTTSTDESFKLTEIQKGLNEFEFCIESNFLSPGSYNLICAILIPGGELIDSIANKVSFEVHAGLNHSSHFQDGRLGVVTPLISWKSKTMQNSPKNESV